MAITVGKRHCQPSTPSTIEPRPVEQSVQFGTSPIGSAKPNHRDQGLDPKHPNVCWLGPFFLVFFLGQQTNVLLGDKISSPNFRC